MEGVEREGGRGNRVCVSPLLGDRGKAEGERADGLIKRGLCPSCEILPPGPPSNNHPERGGFL